MNDVKCPPRSTLYSLPPIGVGTASVESLFSYLCRLAVTHCVSSMDLLHRISETSGWAAPAKNFCKNTNLSGMGDVAERYSSALSEMTSIERLNLLTLRPWRNVIAHNSRAPAKARWCAACFEDDLIEGTMPYFRLAWDIGDVDVCSKHYTGLIDACPDCGRTNARNSATCVVPGWCCYCGASLGVVIKAPSSATPAARWKAAQVGQLLAMQGSLSSTPDRCTMVDGVLTLVERLDGGKSALFARRIGLNKTTVHYWLKQGGVPTLAAHLRIASQTGVSLDALLLGAIHGTVATERGFPSLPELVPNYRKRTSPRQLDIADIAAKMDDFAQAAVSIGVRGAARRLKLHPRELYRLENEKARFIGAKWAELQRARREQHRLEAVRAIEAAVENILSKGKTPNLREVQQLVPREILGGLRGVITMIQEASAKTPPSRD
jgi:hypothetical protein